MGKVEVTKDTLGFREETKHTLKFFNKAIIQMEENLFSDSVNSVNKATWFDFRKVKNIRGGAILRLISVLCALDKKRGYMRYIPPTETAARITFRKYKLFTEMGSPLSEPLMPLPIEFRDVMVISGDKTNDQSRKIRPFLIKLGIDENVATPINDYIWEMINNVEKHAYEEGDYPTFLGERWYLRIAKEGERIVFTLLDNGVGIPATVSKKKFWEEKIWRRGEEHDSFYIFTALKKDNRSSVEGHLGGGLTSVYRGYKRGHLQNLEIFSRRGRCRLKPWGWGYDLSRARNLPASFRGTMFCWDYAC